MCDLFAPKIAGVRLQRLIEDFPIYVLSVLGRWRRIEIGKASLVKYGMLPKPVSN